MKLKIGRSYAESTHMKLNPISGWKQLNLMFNVVFCNFISTDIKIPFSLRQSWQLFDLCVFMCVYVCLFSFGLRYAVSVSIEIECSVHVCERAELSTEKHRHGLCLRWNMQAFYGMCFELKPMQDLLNCFPVAQKSHSILLKPNCLMFLLI